ARRLRRHLRLLSATGRAAPPALGLPVGWRAADAGDRPCADRPAHADPARRALAGPGAQGRGRDLLDHRAHQPRTGGVHAAGRAERVCGLRHRAPRLHHGTGQGRRGRAGAAAARRPRRQALLPRLRGERRGAGEFSTRQTLQAQKALALMNAVADLTLPQKLAHWAKTRPDTVALRQKEFGIWGPVSWREYAHQARCFGMGLMQLGLPAGAHVAVISENRQEWVYAELGCGMAGMVTVGVYATSPAPEVEYLLQAADVQAVVCEDQEQLDKVLE